MTRRERYREHTIDEIKTIARRQMAETGTGSLSINALAREMDMTPSAFYRYFASRDDLITVMISDAWTSLANAMGNADQAQPAHEFTARMTAVLMAYREWALANRVEFDLLFGNPIPNYQPPPECEITPERNRSISVIFHILSDALEAGALKPGIEHSSPPDTLHIGFPSGTPGVTDSIPPVVSYLGVMGWAHLHGILMLELYRHTSSLVSDPDAFYRNEIRFLLRSVGLPVIQ